ncbi:MAG: hypothetical protein Q4C87_00980 [Actinomycetaceae bacterium]|nr:hypothetical protein [Actinomycetaceae bacterium]
MGTILTRSSLAKLLEHFPPADPPIYSEGPTYFGELGEWDFPSDYLAFLKAYGDGRIWDYITPLSPFYPSWYTNNFLQRAEGIEIAREYDGVTKGMPERIKSYADLYPWAQSDVVDTFFWMWTNKEAGEYVVVLHNPKVYVWEIHDLTTTEFLFQLWSGTLDSKEYHPGRLGGDDYFVSTARLGPPDDIPSYSGTVDTISGQVNSGTESLTHLQALCPPPPSPVLYENRIRFSEILSEPIPADYLELAATYGDGAFNDLITMYSPYCPVTRRNYFALNDIRLDELNSNSNDVPPLSIAQSPHELRIWARSANRDRFYWMWTDEAAGEYAIVVHNRTEEIPWEIHHLTFTEFLYQLLSGTLKTEMVSLFCFDPPPSFIPLYTNDDFLRQR